MADANKTPAAEPLYIKILREQLGWNDVDVEEYHAVFADEQRRGNPEAHAEAVREIERARSLDGVAD